MKHNQTFTASLRTAKLWLLNTHDDMIEEDIEALKRRWQFLLAGVLLALLVGQIIGERSQIAPACRSDGEGQTMLRRFSEA